MLNSLLLPFFLETLLIKVLLFAIWNEKKKNGRDSWGLQYCQYLKKENSYLDKSGEQRKPWQKVSMI